MCTIMLVVSEYQPKLTLINVSQRYRILFFSYTHIYIYMNLENILGVHQVN